MKIVIDCDIPYIKGVLEPFAEVAYLKGAAISPRDVADADAMIIRTRTKCDGKLLAGSRVRLIATATIGFDHIDMDYCSAAGIKVVTAAGSNARGVLQWFGAALAYTWRYRRWKTGDFTVGVVGVGHVGSLIAEYAESWGFDVLCCDPPRQRNEGFCSPASRFVTLGEIASACDIITFHTPLTAEGPDATFHMAGWDFFEKIKPGVLIVNSSRGEVVDSDALKSAVLSGKCTCAIDTWEHEPDIDRELLHSAMLATPHIAGYSAQGKANAASMAVQAVAREFDLPLAGWYPTREVRRITPRPISWEQLRRTIRAHFDIEAQSRVLKAHPEKFEELRNTYTYRQEYF